MTQHVVMYSGGGGSWAAAKRVANEHGTENLTLLFADTLMEDEDLYRFLEESAADVGGQLVCISEGRDVWQVFKDVRYIGNTRIDPCSQVLKRQFMRTWLEENFDPADTVCYLGIDWTELHRHEQAKERWAPWAVESPLCEAPYLSKADIFNAMSKAGIKPPRLYLMGFPHNNCGGFCVKAGQKHFKHLLQVLPERYAYHEAKEQEMREYLGKDVAILRDRRGGTTKPLTLKALRERLENDSTDVDELDWGGCGCVT